MTTASAITQLSILWLLPAIAFATAIYFFWPKPPKQ
jgi:hypothetical protein